LRGYTAHHPRSSSSSYSQPWEHDTSLGIDGIICEP
jgi:hypothetical protein